MTLFRSRSVIVYADGSQMPDRAGAGVIVLDARGELLHIENKILPLMTNNEAEYAALALGLEIAGRYNADVVECRMDSEVIVNQMLGNFAVRSKSLMAYHWQACQLARQFPKVRYTHIPREMNALADALAGEASSGRHWQIGDK